MLSYEQVQQRMKDRNLKNIEKETGISYPTLLKVRNTVTKTMQYQIIEKLSDYFLEQERIYRESTSPTNKAIPGNPGEEGASA